VAPSAAVGGARVGRWRAARVWRRPLLRLLLVVPRVALLLLLLLLPVLFMQQLGGRQGRGVAAASAAKVGGRCQLWEPPPVHASPQGGWRLLVLHVLLVLPQLRPRVAAALPAREGTATQQCRRRAILGWGRTRVS
jgi:hypothetical protein